MDKPRAAPSERRKDDTLIVERPSPPARFFKSFPGEELPSARQTEASSILRASWNRKQPAATAAVDAASTSGRVPNLVHVHVVIRPSGWSILLEDQPSELSVLSVLFDAIGHFTKEGEDPTVAQQLARHGINHCHASLTPTALLSTTAGSNGHAPSPHAAESPLSARDFVAREDELDVDFSSTTIGEVAASLGYQDPKDYRSQPPFVVTLRVSGNGPSHVHRISSYWAASTTPRSSVADFSRRTPATSSTKGTPPSGPAPKYASASLSPLPTAASPPPAPETHPSPSSAHPSRAFGFSSTPEPLHGTTPPVPGPAYQAVPATGMPPRTERASAVRVAVPAPSAQETSFTSAAQFFLATPKVTGSGVVESAPSPSQSSPIPVAERSPKRLSLDDAPLLDNDLQPESPPDDRRDAMLLNGSNPLMQLAAVDVEKAISGPFELDISLLHGNSTANSVHTDGEPLLSPMVAPALSPTHDAKQTLHKGRLSPSAVPSPARSVHFSPIQPRVSRFDVTSAGKLSANGASSFSHDNGTPSSSSLQTQLSAPAATCHVRMPAKDREFTPGPSFAGDVEEEAEQRRSSLFSAATSTDKMEVRSPEDHEDHEATFNAMEGLETSGERTRPGNLMSWRGILSESNTRGQSPQPLEQPERSPTASRPLSTIPSRMQSTADLASDPSVSQLIEQLRLAMSSPTPRASEDPEAEAEALRGTRAHSAEAAARSLSRLVAYVREGDEDAKGRAVSTLLQVVEEQREGVVEQVLDLGLPSFLVANFRGPSEPVAAASFDLLVALAKSLGDDKVRVLSECGALSYLLSALISDRGSLALRCLERLCSDSPQVCQTVIQMGAVRVLSTFVETTCPPEDKPAALSVLLALTRADTLAVVTASAPQSLLKILSYQADEATMARCLQILTVMAAGGAECAALLAQEKDQEAELVEKVNGILLVSPLSLQASVIDLMLVLMSSRGPQAQRWIDAFSAAGSVKHLITPLRESSPPLTLKIANLILCFSRSTTGATRQLKSPQLLATLGTAERRAHEQGDPAIADAITHAVVALWSVDID